MFVFVKEKKCKALCQQECEGCSFYKTKEQLEDERNKSEEALKKFSHEYVAELKLKYGGSEI